MRTIPESAYTNSNPYDLRQTSQVRIAAICCSSVSIVASAVAFCWFGRMEKRFRHRLIMILFYGDLVRSAWYFIFTMYSHVAGLVKTETVFCQASGFFLQYGIETSDYAVLVIAIHSALQVFRPANRGKSDLLHHYRYFVFAGAFIIPGLMAGLAFVKSRWGYLQQGAYCMLPIRPLWYMLALTWVPRYIIILTIFGLAIAIYAYVGFEFRSYDKSKRSGRTPCTTTNSIISQAEASFPDSRSTRRKSSIEPYATQGRRASSIAHEILASQRTDLSVAFIDETAVPTRARLGSVGTMQPLSESSLEHHTEIEPTTRKPVFSVPSSPVIRQIVSSPSLTSPPLTFKPPINSEASRTASLVKQSPSSSRSTSPMSPAQRHLIRQRKRIYRQMRLMFIYPFAYSLMWLIPFIHHCTQYNDYLAARPILFFRLGATVCISSMGFVDCLIFSIREKPWRSISTSDGTFWGSFAVWHTPKTHDTGTMMLNDAATGSYDINMTNEGPGESTIARIRSSVRTSASDDYTRSAAEQARLRLDMEKKARRARFRATKLERRNTHISDDVNLANSGSEESGDAGRDGNGSSEGKLKGKGKERATGPRQDSVDF